MNRLIARENTHTIMHLIIAASMLSGNEQPNGWNNLIANKYDKQGHQLLQQLMPLFAPGPHQSRYVQQKTL